MNRFYEVIHNNSKDAIKTLDVFVGDEKVIADIGCFELMLIINEDDQIKKMECNFLLDCSGLLFENLAHPSLVYVNLPKDLLHKVNPYDYKMHVTDEKCIDDVSRFTKSLNGTAVYSTTYTGPDAIGRAVRDTQSDIRSYSEKRINCRDIYETIDLPEIGKFRSRKIRSALGPICGFKNLGWYISFHTTMPSVLQHITYNTLNECSIDQFHGGKGDNNK
jgi:hypothetical protein